MSGGMVYDADIREALAHLAAEAFDNSKRWFPHVHERPPLAVAVHMALGLAGEAGEVADLIKKIDACTSPDLVGTCHMHAPGKHSRKALASELADTLVYLLNLCAHYDIDLLDAVRMKQAECEKRWGDS